METSFLKVQEEYLNTVKTLIELSKDQQKYNNLNSFYNILKRNVFTKLVDFSEMENMFFIILEADSEVKYRLAEKYMTMTEEQYNKNRQAVETFIEIIRNFHSRH